MEPSKKEALDKKWHAIVLKALSDEEFKIKLVKDPANIMIENGLNIPEGCKVGTTSNNTVGLQLPPNASDAIKEEATWWKWRLEMTHNFGKDEGKKSSLASGGAPLMDTTPEM
jgi:hypothetical protein